MSSQLAMPSLQPGKGVQDGEGTWPSMWVMYRAAIYDDLAQRRAAADSESEYMMPCFNKQYLLDD